MKASRSICLQNKIELKKCTLSNGVQILYKFDFFIESELEKNAESLAQHMNGLNSYFR